MYLIVQSPNTLSLCLPSYSNLLNSWVLGSFASCLSSSENLTTCNRFSISPFLLMNGLPFRIIDEQLGNNALNLTPSLPRRTVRFSIAFLTISTMPSFLPYASTLPNSDISLGYVVLDIPLPNFA